ncbi:SDR family NAD(P)-dependent oxidoreductase [Paenibacillus favisporus]|uniref:SDR family NAD(P)-dependent oxidoreductase n=1 Tax=Paenibacillus favisporus TaxID=221028 RepID=UPI002DBC3AE5|nr:SDR family NAD(P)-dependent oxidoreductase [Paenibacillus favisporus]MEC0175126.1 SDR family NAD(P)-dependent oxidoreductase [Paenibacillus favisporus]
MDLGLRDKVVVITGSSSGIGAATAEKFGMEGAKVAVTYASGREAAEHTAEKIRSHGAEAIAVHYDLTDDRSMDQAVHQIAETWGGIQVLVNNAVLWETEASWAWPSKTRMQAVGDKPYAQISKDITTPFRRCCH